ncbi:lysine transporter LysE [Burkholderia sp. MSMB617WGS]|uniref:Lysine transporter LysE n=2 Tax=Burkholderiaceae TaxID=119060 RepID=A0ABR5TIA7_9BURK|nr:lysine transporter LysE [Burkholderia savannae]AOK48667.1 lysine transporter LysE [Burkholderia sp. MSMB617WGS]KGS04362.1 lysE type translocator family protein [Burkholderia sp. ABCPW 111]KVG46425.1 lysine transporter LysE [Burkholderia sp. MSMB0265]KVG79084.1 lysine transporter LysE [Burkholderia sp. MSMB2040]KVG90358.1 lysine transporter LysE [Burkholderia sp. MSMB2041]KVG95893.1 lysine transporter LysE [Burkholderia sp. MSMB2042]KVK73500.1 lysine transporter LysE [Burkholderia sp. MSMB
MSFAPTSMLSDGFFLSLSLCLDIGIANVAMLSLTLSHGFKQGFWLGIGSCIGDLVYAALALAGMAVLLQFEAVRWAVWLGGGAVLLVLTWKMAREALLPAPAPATGGNDTPAAPVQASTWRHFARGMLLAMSSPSAILWFAAVGGALIAKAGATTPSTASIFLSGFFLGGLAWTLFLCTLASQGRKRAGAGLMRACHVVSALLFAYFSYSVIVGGYRDLILNAAA